MFIIASNTPELNGHEVKSARICVTSFPEQLEQFETTSNAMAPETVAVKLRKKNQKKTRRTFKN